MVLSAVVGVVRGDANECRSLDTFKLLSECKCCMRKLLHVWNKKLSNQSTIEAAQIESLIKGDKNDCNLSTIGSPLNGCRVNVVKSVRKHNKRPARFSQYF